MRGKEFIARTSEVLSQTALGFGYSIGGLMLGSGLYRGIYETVGGESPLRTVGGFALSVAEGCFLADLSFRAAEILELPAGRNFGSISGAGNDYES